jgi:tetratricopeptide (TPR) repeat protein
VRRAALALALFASFAANATELDAAPSLWERARNPNARTEARLLVGLERLLDARELAGPDVETADRIARAAVAMIDLTKVHTPADPRLAFVMARALLDAHVGRDPEAEALLETAVARLPVSSLLAAAWHDLGVARALRGDYAGARDAQTHVLDLAWAPDERALAYYYRAASEVRLGELALAQNDYRAAAERAHQPEIQGLSRFGIGVVLERDGDLPSAFTALEQGLALYPSDDPLELTGIFFAPPYERFYLAALIAMTRARSENDPVMRRVAYERSVAAWGAYLVAAPADEPWVANARKHRERCVSELRRLPRPRGRRP